MDNLTAKKYFWIFLDVLIAGLIVNVFFFVMPTLDRVGESQAPVRTISVNAEGKTTVKPDIAQFSFSVVTEGPDLEKITSENNKQVADAIKFVKSEGVKSEDIKTTQYNLQPKYEYNKDQRKSYISGYELTQTVFVKIRELDKNLGEVSKILGSLPELGINQISGVSFTVDDPDKFMNEARADAYARAKAKAEFMAKSAGVGLGRVININEYGSPIVYNSYEKMGLGGAGMIAAPSAVAPVEPGSEQLTIQVNITYALKN